MTCICEHVKAEHLLTGMCLQCSCNRYVLDVEREKRLIEYELKAQMLRSDLQ